MGELLRQPVVHDRWMPTPSRGLAFLFISLLVCLLLLALYAVSRYRIDFLTKIVGGCLIVVWVAVQGYRELRKYVFLAKDSSIKEIQRVGSQEMLRWRVILQNGKEYEFPRWSGQSCIFSWGMLLIYAEATSIGDVYPEGMFRRFVRKYQSEKVVLVPSQLGREAYRRLCIQILEDELCA